MKDSARKITETLWPAFGTKPEIPVILSMAALLFTVLMIVFNDTEKFEQYGADQTASRHEQFAQNMSDAKTRVFYEQTAKREREEAKHISAHWYLSRVKTCFTFIIYILTIYFLVTILHNRYLNKGEQILAMRISHPHGIEILRYDLAISLTDIDPIENAKGYKVRMWRESAGIRSIYTISQTMSAQTALMVANFLSKV